MSRRESANVYRYHSFSEILAKVASPPINPTNRAKWQRDFNMNNANMIYGEGNLGPDCWNALNPETTGEPITVKRVTDWLRAGWPAGVEKIHQQIGQIKLPQLTDIRRRGQWRETGDVLSYEKLMVGDYDRAWYSRRKGIVHKPPPLHIFCDISVNCGDSGLFWRGAVQYAFSEAAVRAGHQVCLESVINIEGLTANGTGFLSVTRLKDYNQPINPGALAAMGVNTASLRLMDFGHCIQIPETMHGYGSPTVISLARLRVRGVIDDKAHTLMIPQTMTTKAEAQEWIKKACADLEARVVRGTWHEPSSELGGLVSPQKLPEY